MKKFFVLFVAVLLFGIINVSAATESDLRDKLTKEYTIKGKTVSGNIYAADIDRYLAKYDLSSEDCDFIIETIDYVISLAEKDKATTFTHLSKDSKLKIVSAVSEINKKTSVKAALTSDGVLTVFENDGKTVFTKIIDNDRPRQTGSNNMIVLAAGFISVLGVAYITKKVVKANA